MSQTKRNARRSTALFEGLEGRQLFSVTLGSNLIKNPGAESNTGASNTTTVVKPSNWTQNNHSTTAKYGTVSVFPTSSSPGPSGRGKEFFAGGPTDDESDLFQTIDVSSQKTAIDAKQIHYDLSGWLGGTGTQGDNATLFANFFGSSGILSQVFVGPVTASNRGSAVKLLFKEVTGTLPKGTRSVQIQIHFERTSGTYDDGYADNLSFVLTKPSTATTGTVAGNVFKDSNGNGKQSGSSETGLSGWLVYIDSDNNGQFDPGETSTKTNGSGNYTLTLKPGKYTVRVQVRSGFFETAPHALSFTANVTVGGSITGDKFGVKAISPA